MKSRWRAYTIVALLALLASIIPAAIWPDFLLPIENWNNWYWAGQPSPRPNYSLANRPPILRAEVAVFRALVFPPAYVCRSITGVPTAYGSLWIAPHLEIDGLPPVVFALEHIRWAVPLWIALLIIVYETARAIQKVRTNDRNTSRRQGPRA